MIAAHTPYGCGTGVLLFSASDPMNAVVAAVLLVGMGAGVASAQDRQVSIPDGTEIHAETIEQISSATATEGDRIRLRVESPVVVDGAVVIAQGAIIHGIVSDVGRRGRMGRSGRINIRLESTTSVDGQRVSLRASKGGEGAGRVGTTVALTVLFGPLGLLKSGKDAVIRPGTKVLAYTDQPITVTLRPQGAADAAQAPLASTTMAPLTGLWSGTAGSRSITASIIETGTSISGTGDISNAGEPALPLLITGFSSPTDVALTLSYGDVRSYFTAKRLSASEIQGTLATAGMPDVVVTLRRR